MSEATYPLEYAIKMLRDAVDFAEQEGVFSHARKWIGEVEKSAIAESDLGTHVVISGGEVLELGGASARIII